MGTERDKNVVNLILNPILPFGLDEKNGRKNEDAEKFSVLPDYRECELLNVEGVNLAERGDLENALNKFYEAILRCPGNPSSYNNRAQLYRLLSKIPEATKDLEKALELCDDGQTAAQSHVQKALIYRFQGDDEKAKIEFERAASLGSNFAKNHLVAMNPYAAMCNQMLSEIMTKFQRDD